MGDMLRDREEKRLMKLGKLYEKIQPNPDIRAILWQIMGSCLVGQILENVFILTGEGRNGKSVSTLYLGSLHIAATIQRSSVIMVAQLIKQSRI